jgi:tRNA (cytidine/uridine-2'-O-)-methyltransferase
LFHVVLYQPEIPHNTGSVGRTCLALGAKLWLVRPLGFRIDDYYLRRAGLDYWELLAWQAVDDWQQLLAHLPAERHWYFSARARTSYVQARFAPGDALVFGPESQGLPPEITARHPDRLLRIPLRPAVRSLNLSNSVAIAGYEAWRQWGAQDWQA